MPKERVKRVMAYQYNELDEDAKERAVEAMCDINVDHEWWDYLYEDAKNVGLEIKEFDTYHNTIGGKFTEDAGTVIRLVKENHGKDCDTYQTATEYAVKLTREMTGDEINDVTAEFEYDLLENYLSMLRKEYEYLCSQESIEETIRANEYEFTVDGKFPAI